MVRNRIGNILWGFFWLALGVLLFGRIFGWWEFTLFFPGWWTLLIIIPSAIGMIKYGFGCISTICFILGMLMLLTYQLPEFITTDLVWKLIAPIILIVIGVNVIVRSLFVSTKEAIDKSIELPKPEYTAVFNGQYFNQAGPFYGGSVDAVFGSAKLDLRNAQIDRDIVINITNVFGGTEIYLPPKVKLKVSSVGLFGGTETKRKNAADADATIYINSLCMFGGVNLR